MNRILLFEAMQGFDIELRIKAINKSRHQELCISLFIDVKQTRKIEDLQSCGINVNRLALGFKNSWKLFVLKVCVLAFKIGLR